VYEGNVKVCMYVLSLHIFCISKLFPTVSGQEPPEHPVISKQTGQVFEKRLIEKHLETSDKCPITGEPLSRNDLIDLQGSLLSQIDYLM